MSSSPKSNYHVLPLPVAIPCGWQALKIQEMTAPGDWEWSALSKQWVPVLVRAWVCYGETRIRRMSFRNGEKVRVFRQRDGFPFGLSLEVHTILSSDAYGKQLLRCLAGTLVSIHSDLLQPVYDSGTDPDRPLERWKLEDVVSAEMHPQDNPNFVQDPTPQPEPVIKDSLTTEPNSPEIPDCSIEIGELERCEANEKITIGYTVLNAYDTDAELITEPIQRKRVLYIAGPMRGVAYFNYPMFDRVAKELRDGGNEVISPADEDRIHDGFDPYANPAHAHPDACTFPTTMDFSKTVRRCLDAVLRCDEIVLLPGWENSNGAVAELTLAMWLGKRVRDVRIDDQDRITYLGQWMGLTGLAMQLSDYHLEVEVPYPTGLAEQDDDDDEDILAEASRITRGSRQAQYGPPDQDFRRTAGMWSALFGAKLKDGVTFEPRDVALAMILLKTSRETHQRKRDNWVDIAGYASCGSRCN
jgi:hypothetical protein